MPADAPQSKLAPRCKASSPQFDISRGGTGFSLDQAKQVVQSEPIAALSALAFDKALSNLRRYGNQPDARHQGALMRIVGGLSKLAARELTLRRVWPLQVSCGKTQSIVAWLAALYQLRLPYSVIIAAEKIESLCDIREDLRVNHGVPLSWSGLLHGKGANASMLSTPEDDLPSKQVIFVSHYRVIMQGSLDCINTFRGTDRDLLIWDESMIATTAWAINELDFEAQMGWLRPQVLKYPTNDVLQEAVYYLDRCLDVLTAELAAQERAPDGSRPPLALAMPECSPMDLGRYAEALKDVSVYGAEKKAGHQNLNACLQMLSLSHLPIRVSTAPQRGCAYIAYHVSIPTQFARVGVFDASYPLRTLEHIDRTLIPDPDPDCQGNLIEYPHLEIRSIQHGTGYSTIKKESTQICRAVVDVVKAVPGASLTFTFRNKEDGFDMGSSLVRGLESAGVNLWATAGAQGLTGRSQTMPRYALLRWGEHTSLSEFSYCEDVVLCGILTRDQHELAASYGAQRSLGSVSDEWTSDVKPEEVRQTVLSEQACAAYQALARGSLRVSKNGIAAPMRGWLFHPDHAALKTELDKVFPKARWLEWNTPHLRSTGDKTEKTVQLLVGFLRRLSPDVEAIPIQTIWKDSTFAHIDRKTLQRARKLLEDRQLAPWRRLGYRIVRIPF